MNSRIKICPVCNEVLYEEDNKCSMCNYEFTGEEEDLLSLYIRHECEILDGRNISGWRVLCNNKFRAKITT